MKYHSSQRVSFWPLSADDLAGQLDSFSVPFATHRPTRLIMLEQKRGKPSVLDCRTDIETYLNDTLSK